MKICSSCDQRFSGEATFCPFDGTRLDGSRTDATQPSSDIVEGTIIDGVYKVQRVLGQGGMGVVFEVVHTRLGRRFALKLLKPELARDAETHARFLLEAQAAGQIRHPNVVEITDFASLPDGGAYLVMEYLDGPSLTQIIRVNGALPPRRAVGLARDIALGLEAAHQNGVVHRDLKPDNVIVTLRTDGQEHAKILDFGVAKVAGSARLTRTGIVFGTPHYMSPEQASGAPVDGRTDIYALGVILYQMFTGRVPFEADTYMGVLTKHMFEPPLPPSQRDDAPATVRQLGPLEGVVLKALSKRPEERFQTMGEFVAAMDDGLSTISPEPRQATPLSVRGGPRSGAAMPQTMPQAAVLELVEERLSMGDDEASRVTVRPPLGAMAVAALCGAAVFLIAVTAVVAVRGAHGTAATSTVPVNSAPTEPGSAAALVPPAPEPPAPTRTGQSLPSLPTLAAGSAAPTPAPTATAPVSAVPTSAPAPAAHVNGGAASAGPARPPTKPVPARPKGNSVDPGEAEDPWGR